MHPAQHRALRELYVFTRQLAQHWRTLAERLGGAEGEVLKTGAGAAASVLDEIVAATAERDLHVAGAARFAARVLSTRPVSDRVLERNQAMRVAALDVQHVLMLCGYAAALAASTGDADLQAACARWERKLRQHERAVRRAAIALGERPDEAIAPADASPAGRAGQKLNAAIGTVGEWVDRRAAARGQG
jgi:ATP-dependent protease HslVU (ClpYQ) peptidase subunit